MATGNGSEEPSGHVLGADISQIQLAEARRLAAAAGILNATFETVDAQVHKFRPGSFDLVLSNFGVMFFDDAAAAFANLRKALCHGGRLAFLCWRAREENPFFRIGFAEAAAVLGFREMTGPDRAFSLADTGHLSALLSGAGFGDIEAAAVDEPMLIGLDESDVLEYEQTFSSERGADRAQPGTSRRGDQRGPRPPGALRLASWPDDPRSGMAGDGASSLNFPALRA